MEIKLLPYIIMVLIMYNRAKAITDTIYASSDAKIWCCGGETFNYGTDPSFQTYPNPDGGFGIRSIIKFDLSSISAGSTVNTAKLQLYATSSGGITRDITLNKVQQSPTRNWAELDVTWNRYATGSNWTSSGGDFSSTASSTATCTWTGDPATSYKYYDWTGISADVQNFVDNPSTNYGWIIKDVDEGSSSGYWYFGSGEGVASQRPRIIISYTAPLPIELLFFDAVLNNNKVDLTWATASETNNDFFSIERSSDALIFFPIDTVDGAGTSTQLINYYDADPDPLSGVSYYRLKQTDFSGGFSYSSIVSVNFNGIDILIAYPNPAGNQLSFLANMPETTTVYFDIYSSDGKQAKSFSQLLVKGLNTVTISIATLPPSVYTLKARTENNMCRVQKLFLKSSGL